MATRSFQLAKILGADGDIKAGALDSAAVSTGVTEYATAAVLPSTGNSFGDQALVASNNRLYIWNGSGWYNIALINQNPSFTASPAANYAFDGDSPRSNITINVAASDPESLGVSFSFETSGQLDSMASVTQDSSVFTLVPKGNDSITEGATLTGSLTIKASDGVNVVPAVSSFTLTFVTTIERNAFNQLLLKVSGTGDNNNFDDKGETNHSISASGTVTQGTFNPYRPSGYSIWMHPTGGNSYLRPTAHADFAFGTGDFTVETWIYPIQVDSGVHQMIYDTVPSGSSGSTAGRIALYLNPNKMAIYIPGVGTTNQSSTLKYVVPHKWQHLAWVRTSGTIKMFIDGYEVHSFSSTYNFTRTEAGIGKDFASGGTGQARAYHSNLRIVKGTAVYTTGFTPPTEPLTAISGTSLLLNSYNFDDKSGNNHTVTSTLAEIRPWSPFDAKAYSVTQHGASALFDGNSDFLTYPNSTDFRFGTGDFTVEAWLYPNSVPGGGVNNDMTVFGHFGSPTMFFYISNNNLTPTLWNGSNGYGSSIDLQLKSWNHVAWVRESSTLKIYVNGVEGLSQASYTTDFNAATAPLTGKSSANSTRYYNGYIADLRVVKGTAVYTSAFTPPTAPLTAVTNTKLLMTMNDGAILDNSQAHNLVLQGTTIGSSATQHYGQNTISLDANSDYIELDEPAIPTYSEENYTVDLWFRSADTGRKDFVNQYLASQTGRMALYSESAKIKFFQHGWNGTAAITGPTSWTTNTWHHVALVNSDEARHFYLDGNHQGGAHTAGADMMVQNTKIGALDLNSTLQGFINGHMHDVRISKGLARFPYIAKPVTLTQINSGMEKPDGTFPTATASNTKLLAFSTSTITNDGSASPHTLTAAGSAAASSSIIPAPGMHSAYFANGDADLVTIPASADHQIYGGDYTVEAWLYPTNFNASYNYFASKGDTGTREWAFGLNASHIRVYWSTNGSGSGDTSVLGNVTNRTNEWMHFAATKSGNDIYVFKNGNLVGTGTFTSIYGGNGITTISRLWTYSGIAHSYDGYISNFRIVKGQALYTKNFTPSTTALLG